MGANDRGKTYITVSAVLVALSTIVVGFRIVARWMRTTLGMDDYVICVSIILAYSMLGEAVVWARDGGLGKHMDELSIQEKIIFQKASICGRSTCFFANEISYTLLIPSIKISILLLYRRIFSVRNFRIASLITGGLVVSWCLAVFITVLLQCRPIALNWNKTLEGTCIDPKQFFFGNAISNLLIDVVILALPIPMVLQLQLRLSQKLTILGIFLLGGFVCVASIMRVVTLDIFETMDTSYSVMEAATWTFVEPCVGIICACLPTLRPLLRTLCCSFSWSTDHSDGPPANYRMHRISSAAKNESGGRSDREWDNKRFGDEFALMGGSTKVAVNGDDAS
ncbi:hypothetical protein AFGD_004086 [Aspergillus flavus]|uniref:Rhodopsin domain-containing protein n=2 Tax=Aspergillus flavus TaxID=5059 RepID=A0AB74CMT4_ASPFL|nr:hypothetical protein NYO67_2768 [Aspergillus flavus]RAQ54384.1 hypothetical protein AFGD_004086 [Aspergillus flavus]RMZ46396.1 hypothetical protein CA14_008053 [Aspergillus flavus]